MIALNTAKVKESEAFTFKNAQSPNFNYNTEPIYIKITDENSQEKKNNLFKKIGLEEDW